MIAMQAFEDWLSTLPLWLQTAASELVGSQAIPQGEDIRRLTDLCIAEVTGADAHFATLPAGTFSVSPMGASVRLKGIKDVLGVNALDTRASLDFGDADLVVIYGHNGTGKSGFARLTKHAAGARVRAELLSNVFAEVSPPQQADFIVERSGSTSTTTWTPSLGVLESLRHVHIFDADVARHYMAAKAEASYEPRRLRFLSALVSICDAVKGELEDRKRQLPSRLPTMPTELSDSTLAGQLRSIKASSKPDAIHALCTLSDGDRARMSEVEQALRTVDPATRIAQLDKQMAAVESTLKYLDSLADGLSATRVTVLTDARSTATLARQAATDASSKAFATANLSGVGEGTWRLLWEAARDYSTQVAYPGCEFPHVAEGAQCPLCQQELSSVARQRLGDFEVFVQGEVEKRAAEAERTLKELHAALPVLPSAIDWMARFSSISGAENAAASTYTAVSARRSALIEAQTPSGVPDADFAPLRGLIVQQLDALRGERVLLASAAEAAQRPRLEAELRELKMRAWAQTNREAILEELDRLTRVETLDRAIKKTTTAALTKKKGELAQEELTGGYQARFADELKALGADRIPVKPVEAGKAKGKVEFSLAVVGAKRAAAPHEVLSEGEARIVALAAFLADVGVAAARTPFIFDDPISSLDQDFEERVVARLLDLARTRQVLVFTHRLSLLGLLREAVKKERELVKAAGQGTAVTLHEIALRRMGGRIGLATGTNVLESKVDKALNDLIGNRLALTRKAYDAGDVDAYASTMKAICSDLRILTERAVEEELLNGVVMRFRRSVTTMNKLAALAKIAPADCKLLDDIMTRYSCFEHSQPAELPAPLPELAEVQSDAMRLRDWVVEFRKRQYELPKPAAVTVPDPGPKNLLDKARSEESPL